MAEKFGSNIPATKLIAEIFVSAWKTVDAKASKSETRIDSIAATFSRAIFSGLPFCLKCDDVGVIKPLCVALQDALSSIYHRPTKLSIITNAASALKGLVDYGLRPVKEGGGFDDQLIDAILDIVVLKDEFLAGEDAADLLKAACTLFALSRRSEGRLTQSSSSSRLLFFKK